MSNPKNELRFKRIVSKTLRKTIDLLIGALALTIFLSAYMPIESHRYHLENSRHQTILFEGMYHIGTEEYYNNIHDDILNNTHDHTLILIEGIYTKNTPKETHPAEKDANPLYDFMAHKVHLTVQNYTSLLANIHHNGGYVRDIDVSFAQIKNTQTIEHIEHAPSQSLLYRLPVSPQIYRAFLRANLHLQSLKNEKITNQSDYYALITQRNKPLVKEITNNTQQKDFIIVYGDEHWADFYAQLTKSDPSWTLTSTETRTAF